MPGPAPKPPSQRRRRNTPASYGAATPATAPAASGDIARELGIDNPHPLITSMWHTVETSCEATFFSDADWARLRLECWFANQTMASGQPSAKAWAVIQDGMNDMLLSPALKRRVGIEVRPPVDDPDEDAAVSMIGRYRQSLKPV